MDEVLLNMNYRNLLHFLIEIHKLKEMPRTGWVLRRVKNPETIADHTFRVAFSSWLLAKKIKLNVKRAIKIALSHDLCEVYAGDVTPFFYYLNLPEDKKERKKFLMNWVRLSQKEKEKRSKVKFEKEKKAIEKLLKPLDSAIKKDIYLAWLDYEKGISKEGVFIKQLDRIETLIQSIEYFGSKTKNSGTDWWEGTEEIVHDPFLLVFLKVVQKKFYSRFRKKLSKQILKSILKTENNKKDLENILNFLLKIGKLKRLYRLYWLLREVKNPETVAAHIFTLAIIAWVFGKEEPRLDQEKLFKMALCHEISAIYTGDTTPYDRILPKEAEKRKELLKRMVRLPKEKKEEFFFKDYQEEKNIFEKLTSRLSPELKHEIIYLWNEYRTKSSFEGYFLFQLNVIAVLLQALIYEKNNKEFNACPVWEWALENIDHPSCLKFLKEMEKEFYRARV